MVTSNTIDTLPRKIRCLYCAGTASTITGLFAEYYKKHLGIALVSVEEVDESETVTGTMSELHWDTKGDIHSMCSGTSMYKFKELVGVW